MIELRLKFKLYERIDQHRHINYRLPFADLIIIQINHQIQLKEGTQKVRSSLSQWLKQQTAAELIR